MPGADFSNYELSSDLNVHALAGGLLPEIAEAVGFKLAEQPDEQNLEQFIGKVAPEKEFRQNIGIARQALGGGAEEKIAGWIERSGILSSLERSFIHNSEPPSRIDTIVWGGGVANWMLRRAAMTQRVDPEKVDRVLLPMGKRRMRPEEHQLVETYGRRTGELPTEADFAGTYIRGSLALAGFEVEVIEIDDEDGDSISDSLFRMAPILLEDTLMVVGNAPNTVQAAGQLRMAARRLEDGFDSTGEQLFMTGDSIPLARHGETSKTYQDPETALGQLIRNALFLERNRTF